MQTVAVPRAERESRAAKLVRPEDIEELRADALSEGVPITPVRLDVRFEEDVAAVVAVAVSLWTAAIRRSAPGEVAPEAAAEASIEQG